MFVFTAAHYSLVQANRAVLQLLLPCFVRLTLRNMQLDKVQHVISACPIKRSKYIC
jgi:hypothetical protein